MLNKRLFQWLTPLVLSVFFPGRENWLSSEGGGVGVGRGGQSVQAPAVWPWACPFPSLVQPRRLGEGLNSWTWDMF